MKNRTSFPLILYCSFYSIPHDFCRFGGRILSFCALKSKYIPPPSNLYADARRTRRIVREKKVCRRTADKETSHPIWMAKPTWLSEFLLTISVPTKLSAVLSSALWGVSVFETEKSEENRNIVCGSFDGKK